eukprot:2660508-Pyramimonas_sp.AAC.1
MLTRWGVPLGAGGDHGGGVLLVHHGRRQSGVADGAPLHSRPLQLRSPRAPRRRPRGGSAVLGPGALPVRRAGAHQRVPLEEYRPTSGPGWEGAAIIMSSSCHHHVVIMSSSCRHHVVIMASTSSSGRTPTNSRALTGGAPGHDGLFELNPNPCA